MSVELTNIFRLSPSKNENILFFRMKGDAVERHGAIGYLRADFGNDGYGFYFKWFYIQPHLKTPAFRKELDSVINNLRTDGQETPFANRKVLEAYCAANPGKELSGRGYGYSIQTEGYSYYFRCFPQKADYDVCCFVYDNRFLLPELAGKHKLPVDCFSLLPSSGELILIVREIDGYYPTSLSTPFPDVNQKIADEFNGHLNITRAQEKAMLAGSLFGWNAPAAKPWKYDLDGKLLPVPQKEKEPNVR